ncbi:MAG: Coq4 family protein [Myxococcota bacterium]|nr:Coq4 family protein [Myxococcota bacterium]
MEARPRREWWLALRAGARWMLNPVSEMGAANSFRFSLSIAQPEIFALRDAMRTDPTGRRILQERPDLGAALNDMDHLATLPEGSLGRCFHTFMSHPDTVPGYLLAGLAYEGGYFERLPWDEELKWVLERLFNTHDLSHVVSGYGADLAGEGLNIFFGAGTLAPGMGFRGASLTPFGALVRLTPPPIGRSRWRSYLQEAFERGWAVARHQPFPCIPWEELLPLPIEEARERVGLPPLHEPDLCSADWGKTWIMERIESGHGATAHEKERMLAYRAAIEAGVSVRALMRCPLKTRLRIGQQALQGKSSAELLQQAEDAWAQQVAA